LGSALFLFLNLKKIKFQKYMSIWEIFKNGCLVGDKVTVDDRI